MKLIKTKGIYDGRGSFLLEADKAIRWKDITNEIAPGLPFEFAIEITISFEEKEFLLGNGGIVWATYDFRQTEIIKNALLALLINSEIKNIALADDKMFVLKISKEDEINEAIDFIWRSESGLRLKPDWDYERGKINRSFNQWINGD